MLDANFLLDAMSGVHETQVIAAGKMLGYMDQKQGRVNRKLWSTLLVAAILISLFTVTAYALGWFGFSSRLTPAPPSPADAEPIPPEYGDPSDHHYFSYSGAMDSDVMKASLEWQEYVKACMETEEYMHAAKPENEQEFLRSHPELKPYHDIYGIVTEEMADKLAAISEAYGVRLHNAAAAPANDGQFHELGGIGNFILRREGDFEFQCYVVYEDGSFHGFGFLPFDGIGYPFTFVKSANDVLDPTIQELYGSRQYEEWQYTTKTGALVNIASWDWGHPEDGESLTWVFYEDEDTIITVFGTTPLGRENCEAFADCFDFAEAGK